MQQTVYIVALNSFNHLKKNSYCMHAQFYIQKLLILPKLCNYDYHSIVSLNNMQNRTFSVISKHCFSCEEATEGVYIIYNAYTEWQKKNGNFWKTQQKLKKSKKKIYWQKLNNYNLPFKRQ